MSKFATSVRAPLAPMILLLAALGGVACQPTTDSAPEPGAVDTGQETADLQARAETLAKELLLVDTHIDVPYRLERNMADVSQATEGGDFDYPRAVAGGLDSAFMSIYVPASYQEEGGAKEFADGLIDMVEGIANDAPDKFVIATSPDEVEEAFANGLISFPLGMENGAPIEDDLSNVEHFYDRGIRYITLTHSKNNQICDSSYEEADNRQWGGLSPFGREVVEEMNRLGIMVDISHVSDDAFYQVLEVTQAPVIASHSSARAFTPGFERNMDDAMIQKLAENGGVIQINFGSSFLIEAANTANSTRWEAVRQFAEENGLDPENNDEHQAQVGAFMEQYQAENPQVYADLDDVVDHIDHVVQLVGIDHVGIGSDYDGVGDSLPTGLKDVSQFPNLIRALLEKGYSEEDIGKIWSDNLMRVWRDVERVASEMQASES